MMKIILPLILTSVFTTLSFGTQAKLEVKFNLKPAVQIKDNNDNYTNKVNLNLSVTAKLDYQRDEPNLKTDLGYEFLCEGDNKYFKNIARTAIARPNLTNIRLEYTATQPNLWDSWEAGTKSCALSWTGTVVHVNSQTNTTNMVTISSSDSTVSSDTPNESSTSSTTNSIRGLKPFTMMKSFD